MSAAGRRPNIVLILSDDQGAWAMGCAGNPEIETPNLDRLAGEGIRFRNFFCASPVCSPARASILTGRIPSQHGVHDWIMKGNVRHGHDDVDPIEYLAGQPAYTELLAASGYTCGLAGKWHLGDSARPQKGFASWRVHAFGGGPYYGAPLVGSAVPDSGGGPGSTVVTEPRYVTDVFTDWAVDFIDGHAGGENPFYLSLHYTAPHSPWERDDHPAALWDRYRNEGGFTSIPEEPPHPWSIVSAPSGTGDRRRDLLAGYFAAVTAMDAGVGRVLDALARRGIADETIVVFTSDNGMNMGHHGIWGKGNGTFPQNMYDTSVKVPAIVRWPGHVAPGSASDALVSQYDFFPTILEIASVANPYAADLPGSSFAGLLEGAGGGAPADGGGPAAEPSRDRVYVFDEYGPVRMVRTAEWKYVHRYPYGPHELYDLRSDPDERANLVRDPGHADRVAQLRHDLESWFVRYVDPARDGTREGVTGKGQLGLAGPAGGGETVWAGGLRFTASGQERGPESYSPFSTNV